MVKKIVEVPDGAVKVIFATDDKANYANKVSYMLEHQVDIESLSDVSTVEKNATVDKRVIELPADALAEFEALKQTRTLLGLLETVYDRGLQMAIPLVSDAAKQKVIGEYYSNHAEFVSKEESKFVVEVVINKLQAYVRSENNEIVEFYVHKEDATKFTNEEADNLVAGLRALNSRKVRVEK